MNAFGKAAPGAPAAHGRGELVDTVVGVHPYEELGSALHRLARMLDELLLVGGDPRREELRVLRLLSTDALHALGSVMDELHGQQWDGSVEAGLRAVAAEYAEATGAASHVRIRGSTEQLSDDVVEAFRKVAVEALRNVDRHARASVLLLSLDIDDACVALDIVDDGVDLARRQVAAWGSAVDLGLHRMDRAMHAVGGSLTIHPLRPRGLRLRASVPPVAGSVQ